MTRASRAVLFVAGAGLVAAWLAAAADRQATPDASAADPSRDANLARAEHLAEEIQSQATRLHAHLAAPPQPAISGRNPFTFEEPSSRAPRRAATTAATAGRALEAALAASEPEPPPLTLSGIAEDPAGSDDAGKPAPPIRVAVLSGYGEVFLAKVGETIASRYQVTAIGADAVEVNDLLTGRTIRLGLR